VCANEADVTAENTRVEICTRIRDDLGLTKIAVSSTPWQVNDFSSCFGLEWNREGRIEGAYVKLPKADMTRKSIMPVAQADRELAINEYRSLNYLALYWVEPDLRVAYVRPLSFYADLNAIVTARVWGRDLLLPFRRFDITGRIWPASSAQFELLLSRIGSALANFHAKAHEAEGGMRVSFDSSSIRSKVGRVLDDLRALGGPPAVLSKIEQKIDTWPNLAIDRPLTMTLKGLDIRNVLIDESANIRLLDPGKLKNDFVEADLARLLVTCRIVWWGTVWFFLRLRPQRRYENAIVSAYHALLPIDQRILSMYTVKELAKHWRAAYCTVARKPWPPSIKRTLLRTYVDRFYSREISRQLDDL
jgi:hypothetical protein